MKLVCDLCGGNLQMNSGGKGAVCVDCGITYTTEYLREKLGVKSAVKEEVKYVPHDDIEIDVPEELKDDVVFEGQWESAEDTDEVFEGTWESAESEYDIDGTKISWNDVKPVPLDSFKMTFTNAKNLKGKVKSGFIKLGDVVYLDGMSHKSAVVTHIERVSKAQCRLDGFIECASKGDEVFISLETSVTKKELHSASFISGGVTDENYFPDDMYNYWGSVEEYFTEVFLRYLSEYDVFRDCKLFDGNYPVDFVLCKDGEIKLAVIFYGDAVKGDDRTKEKSVRKCVRNGIPAICFFDSYRNKVSYIVDRVTASAKK